MFKRKAPDTGKSPDALKKKALLCSTEAAAISIGIHALLIILAGSIVAIRYVQKRDAAFSGENVDRPKLERRQLQMPVKVKNLQKKSRRPKVTTRMASVSQSSFSLPDMMGLGDLGASGFDRGGGDRSLSSMGSAGSLGFGISGVNFFGVKSKGEKMIFLLDAEKRMVEDRKGGFVTYKFAKQRMMDMIEGMNSATLFNVIVYNNEKASMFRKKMVPATPENREAAKKWLAPVNKSPSFVAQLDHIPGAYKEPRDYESKLIKKWSWVRAVQAAMEQLPDNIFILCNGYVRPNVSDEEVMKIHGIESKEDWLASKGWDAEKVNGFHRKKAELHARAQQKLAEENRARRNAGKDPKIVIDWWYYISQELKWDYPEMPELWRTFYPNGYDPDLILEHLEAVYTFNYVPKKLPKPAIHIVKLIAADGSPIDAPGGDAQAFKYVSLKQIPKAFRGRFELLRGADTVEAILKNNQLD